MVTGNVSFVSSRCSIAAEMELSQDSVNRSQISFALRDSVFPGKQEVEGGAAVIEGERNQVFFSFRHRMPVHDREAISVLYRLRRSGCLPPPP